MRRLIVFLFIVSFNILPALPVSGYASESMSEIDWSRVNVVTIYQTFADELHGHAELAAFVNMLADTATDLVWHACYVSPGVTQYCIGFQNEVKYVKARLPWVLFEGAVDAYDYCPASRQPDPSIVYGNGASGSYWAGYSGCYPLDIAKPGGTQIVIRYADQLIDSGADMLHFDCVGCLANAYNLPIGPYVNAWKLISSSVKQYAKGTYGKDIPLTINNGCVQTGNIGPVFPSQDFLDLALCGPSAANMIKTRAFPIPWDDLKADIMRTYGRLLPMILFIDTGGPGDPMPTFARLPRDDQIEEIKMLSSISMKEGMRFAYPLYGLGETPFHQGMSGGQEYNAIEHGTYDTIRQLTNSISSTAPKPGWATLKQVLGNLTRAESNLKSDKANSILMNATSTYTQMVQAFIRGDDEAESTLATTTLQLITLGYHVDVEYQTALGALTDATAAIRTAESQNRTSGLDAAKHLFSLGYQALTGGNYSDAINLAIESRIAAEAAKAPSMSSQSKEINKASSFKPVILLGMTIIILTGLAIVLTRRKQVSRDFGH